MRHSPQRLASPDTGFTRTGYCDVQCGNVRLAPFYPAAATTVVLWSSERVSSGLVLGFRFGKSRWYHQYLTKVQHAVSIESMRAKVSIVESDLSDNAFRVYSYLKYLGFRDGPFKIRYELMARTLKRSPPTLYRAVKELKKEGYLVKLERSWSICDGGKPKPSSVQE